jgi:hypothetical protein
MEPKKSYALEDAIQAQKALRTMAGLEPETFPVDSFVGMISDEIEQLRAMGHSDQDIANVISGSSKIEITADEIAEFYASPEQRHPPEG